MSLVITQGYGDPNSGGFSVVSVTPYVDHLEILFDQAVTLVGLALTATNWTITGGTVTITASSVNVVGSTVYLYHNEAKNGESLTLTLPYAGIFFGTDPYAGPLTFGFTSVGVGPTISYVRQTSAVDLEVTFDEDVQSAMALDTANWAITGGYSIASVSESLANVYVLTLNAALLSATSYTLTATNIEDLAGNPV